MNEDTVAGLFDEAAALTSIKEASLNLAFEDGSEWVFLFRSRGDELAIRVASCEDEAAMRERIRDALMRLS